MIITFKLEGSQKLHSGTFDTTGFWVRFETEYCDITKEAVMYKLFSHFSFEFAHTDKDTVLKVFAGLNSVLSRQVATFRLDSVGSIVRVGN